MTDNALHAITKARGPFVSLLVDDSHETHDAAQQAHARWTVIARELEDNAVSADVIATLQRAVVRSLPAAGRKGRLIIAGPDGVLLDEQLATVPVATILRVSSYPYLLPVLAVSAAHRPYVFVSVDHLGADLAVHGHHGTRTETVEGPGFPVHKPAAAGWHGYGDVEHSAEEAVRMNIRFVAEQVTAAVDGCDAAIVFVCGEVRARTELISALPARVGTLAVPLPGGAQGRRTTEREVAERVAAEFARLEQERVADAVARYEAETARRSGLAVQGLPDVCAALSDGAVETLMVGPLGSATVVTGHDLGIIAPDADSLSEFGEAPVGVAPADEALPFLAVLSGASVVRVPDGPSLTDGVGALLRYPRAASSRVQGP
ncbi:uncharacterized protein RMCC_0571 [Mycolicibacterium canariasense]|uniref:Peptide chain release factor 1 n=1 Tax=Mycolicibacterium canariasense TaxID=228230 RepID=A0A117I8R1_MYCCR|nr:hypothetical protein [Mycolicibacterium canariasense]MCV7213355.1 hypothetical protein [Mycolicibacterium canariasense]ORV10599.1 hypothetical protein AWB94_06755 [Mycolicibacterium canariasense]GAS93605.1 uncharacterized protein RMCC_0571 [Mycolicibacterium canariasense]